jgi:tetratricopeptide (TPR) repeat protein
VLGILEKAVGLEHPAVASTLNDLGNLYTAQARWLEAEPLYERALSIRLQAFGREHPDVATSLHNLAHLYFLLKRNEQAEFLCLEALALREKTLGTVHPEVAQSLECYSAILHSAGRVAAAVNAEARARVIRAWHAQLNAGT